LTRPELEILATMIAERLSTPRWMKLSAAAKYASIGQKELIRLVKEGEIDGFQDLTLKTKQWIVDKNSIDKYRSGQVSEFKSEDDSEDNETVALDIIASLEL
jgi:DNA-binding MurR/RpiR family transcriptional regulator